MKKITKTEATINPNEKTKTRKKPSKQESEQQLLQQNIIQELSNIAFSSIDDFCAWSAEGISIIESIKINPQKLSAIAELNENAKGKTVGIKLHPKLKALEILLKALKDTIVLNQDSSNGLKNESSLATSLEQYTLEWERVLEGLSESKETPASLIDENQNANHKK